MNADEKVQRLRGLLERIRGNVARPRPPFPSAVVSRALEGSQPPRSDDVEEELVLLDDEIVEVSGSTLPPPVMAAAPVDVASPDSIDFDEDDEEEAKPASSRRPKALESGVDELTDEQASLDDAEHEVPIKTPPPESGPQSATPVPSIGDPGAMHAAESALASVNARPTVEQLGQTIDLEESGGPPLELAPAKEPEPPPPPEELEATFDEPERVTEAAPLSEPFPPAPVEPPAAPMQPIAIVPPAAPMQPVAEPPIAALQPVDVGRPSAPSAAVAEYVGAAPEFRPASFLELLDASLALGQ
jgi:hypothetical protein